MRDSELVSYARRWSELHHGIDPAAVPMLSPWLRTMWWLARPLASAGVPPTLVTALGAASALGSVKLADRRPSAAAVAVFGAAVCDGLDGAVAVVGSRASRSGAFADAVADRFADVAFAGVLWRCGAPRWLAGCAASLAVGVDVARRMRSVPGRITVAERPTWTICAALACVSSTRTPARWPAAVCASVACALGFAGLSQILRRR